MHALCDNFNFHFINLQNREDSKSKTRKCQKNRWTYKMNYLKEKYLLLEEEEEEEEEHCIRIGAVSLN